MVPPNGMSELVLAVDLDVFRTRSSTRASAPAREEGPATGALLTCSPQRPHLFVRWQAFLG